MGGADSREKAPEAAAWRGAEGRGVPPHAFLETPSPADTKPSPRWPALPVR